ncbi:hypothetical protein P9112_008756 [Eukaryota sp. TZLM1-RC]
MRHAQNCSELITYRSSLHDAVRDTVFNMAQIARISCIKESLLKETLSLNNFGSDDRGDVYCDWIDNSEAIVDFVSCNVANDTLVHRTKLNPVSALDLKANEKHRKYDKEIEDANVDRNTQLVFIAFPFSINGRLSVEAETFLDDFQEMVKEKTMKRFDIFLWRSRIQFAIINRLPRFINRIREALARQQANQDFVEEILAACENKSSDSSLFVTIVPQRFGLCASNEAFVTKLRLYLNIPINQLLSKEKCICSNSPQLSLRHAQNCSELITYRSSLHDAVRDTVFNMAQIARISCIKESLLKETLSLNNFGSDDRGDVYCDWIDNSEAIVDFVSCNVANDTLVHRTKLNPVSALDLKANEKHRKYDKDIEEANTNRNTQLVFIAFPFLINGRLSGEAETFLNDFQKIVQEKTMRRFDIFLWRSRIQFAIINR